MSADGFGDLLDLVANDPGPLGAEADYDRFVSAIFAVKVGNRLSLNDLRAAMSNEHGLVIEPRRYSALFSRARKDGYIKRTEVYERNTDHRGRNCGKPSPVYVVLRASP